MEKWVGFALVSMLCAGVTSVAGKLGIAGISIELALTVRAFFVVGYIFLFALVFVPIDDFGTLSSHNLIWLGVSGFVTALAWIFFYKALQEGDVATVTLIDKGSIVVAIVLAYLLLKEPITLRIVLGAGLIVAGLFVIARK